VRVNRGDAFSGPGRAARPYPGGPPSAFRLFRPPVIAAVITVTAALDSGLARRLLRLEGGSG